MPDVCGSIVRMPRSIVSPSLHDRFSIEKPCNVVEASAGLTLSFLVQKYIQSYKSL